MSKKKIKMTGQPETHPQAFFNPLTPKVKQVARPVAQVAHAQPGDKTGELITQGIQQISGSATNLMNWMAKSQQKKGLTDAMKKKERPESASDAYMRGFEKFAAEADALTFANDLHQDYLRSGDLTPEEWLNYRTERENEYLIGRSDEYIRSFTPLAIKIVNRYDKQIMDDQRNHIIQDHLSHTKKHAEFAYEDIMGDDTITSSEQRGKAFRAELDKLQVKSKELGLLNRSQVAEEFIKTVGSRAVKDAKPGEMLAFIQAYEEKDKSGFSLSHQPKLADLAYRYYDQAVNAAEASERQRLKALEDEKKRMAEISEKIFINYLEEGTPESLVKAVSKFQEIWEDVNPARYHSYVKRLYELSDDANWARTSDPHVYSWYHSQALKGEFSEGMIAEANLYVDRDTFVSLVKLNNNAKHQIQEAGPQPMKYFQDTVRSLHNRAMTTGANDPVGKLFDDGPAREREWIVTHEMNQRLDDFLRFNEYKDLTFAQIQQWGEEVYDKAMDEQKPQTMSSFRKGGGGRGVQRQAPSGQTQKEVRDFDEEETQRQSTILNRLKQE